MPQSCRCCALPPKKRNQLEKSFIDGVNIYQLTKMYGISDTSIKFHVENHLPERLVSQAKDQSAFDSTQLLKKINQVCDDLRIIYDRNVAKEKDSVAIKAAKELRNTLQLLVQISVALGKTKAEELERERDMRKQFIDVTELPIGELSQGAQELLFEIAQKQIEGFDYSDVKRKNELGREPELEPSGFAGGSEVKEENSLKKNTPAPPFIRRRKPNHADDPKMTFKPIENSPPAKDFKLERSRRSFARSIQSDEDPYTSTVV